MYHLLWHPQPSRCKICYPWELLSLLHDIPSYWEEPLVGLPSTLMPKTAPPHFPRLDTCWVCGRKSLPFHNIQSLSTESKLCRPLCHGTDTTNKLVIKAWLPQINDQAVFRVSFTMCSNVGTQQQTCSIPDQCCCLPLIRGDQRLGALSESCHIVSHCLSVSALEMGLPMQLAQA